MALDDVLRRAARAVQGAAAGRDVTLDVGDVGADVRGHARDLERLFCNLFENAIRHSPPAGWCASSASAQGERVRVRVIDGGPGVPAADRERIFEPFYRSAAAYATPGYGLGLAIARKIARAHGGEVAVAERDSGAEFVVELHARVDVALRHRRRTLAALLRGAEVGLGDVGLVEEAEDLAVGGDDRDLAQPACRAWSARPSAGRLRRARVTGACMRSAATVHGCDSGDEPSARSDLGGDHAGHLALVIDHGEHVLPIRVATTRCSTSRAGVAGAKLTNGRPVVITRSTAMARSASASLCAGESRWLGSCAAYRASACAAPRRRCPRPASAARAGRSCRPARTRAPSRDSGTCAMPP